jgi:membrane protease YdiL (CAAX protease family)
VEARYVSGLGFTGINFLLSLIRFGVPHPSAHAITWNSILGTSLFIGFVEEIPFRGFIFQIGILTFGPG